MTGRLFGVFVLAFVVLSTAWVLADARRLRPTIGDLDGWSPPTWVLVTALVWVIGFPLYVLHRRPAVLAVERSWWQRWPAAAAGLALAAVVAALAASALGPHIDSARLDAEIAADLRTRGYASAQVRCPSRAPMRTDYRFVCPLDVGGVTGSAVVTEINGTGDVTWQIVGLPPPGAD